MKTKGKYSGELVGDSFLLDRNKETRRALFTSPLLFAFGHRNKGLMLGAAAAILEPGDSKRCQQSPQTPRAFHLSISRSLSPGLNNNASNLLISELPALFPPTP